MVTEKASERRASTRRPIKLAAKLEIDTDGCWPCQITDFCAEGLFLRYSAGTSRQIMPYFAAESPPIRVVFREPDGRQSHILHAQPVRRIDGAMGVEFTESAPTAIAALLRLCSDGAPAPGTGSGPGGDRATFILRQCTRETVRFIEPMMNDWFRVVDRQLNDHAQHATSEQQAHDFIDAAIKLRARQRPFWHMMSQVIESPMRQPDERAPGGRSQLNLVEKGDFEDWLLLRVMVTKAETQFRGPLLQLKMRLDKAGVVLQSGHQNALGPILVCDAFRQALEHLDCSRVVDKAAFRVFEQEVVRHLEKLYTALNQILIRQGILPDLDLSKYLTERNPVAERAARAAKRSQSQSESQPSVPARGEAAVAKPASDTPPQKDRCTIRKRTGQADARAAAAFHRSSGNAQSAFATVGNLLSSLKQSRAAGDAATAAAATAPIFSPVAKPLSLTELQRELGEIQTPAVSAGELTLASLRQRVIDRVGALEARRLNPEQETTVDVVDRFFASLEQSPRLNSMSRVQLQRLGMPVLRAVLQERHHFEAEDSPVRGVLNRIAQLGMRGNRQNPVLQRKIDALIEHINRGFDNGAQVFRDALDELDDLVARQNLAYRRNVERVSAAAEGAQKVEDARHAVGKALERRLAGQQVPRVLMSLLSGGWRDLLSLTFVRQGPDSSAWNDHLTVIDSLMAFSRDPEMAIDLPELLRIIQEGLATVSSSQVPAGQVRDELKRFLTARGPEAFELIEMPRLMDSRRDLSGLSETRQKDLQRWMNRAQALQVGDWMKFQEDPSNPSYMRLVWIGKGGSRFVFVNHQGMKVVELDLLRISSHLQKGMLVPDPDYERPIVDESIDRMLQQVYEQAAKASNHDQLTGLLNRREFERCLGRWLAASGARDAAASPEQKVLAVLELQQLRELSDGAGFNAGDEALRQVANLLRALAPEAACLARLAGSRVGLLLDAATAEAQLSQLVERIKTLSLSFGGKPYTLSVNGTLAIEQPGLATPEKWLAAAEEVLIRSRRERQSEMVWYAPEPGQASELARVAAKVAALENLDRERILLRCQKIIPLHGETVLGVQHQVLFNIYDDYGQLIHGAEFLRMAEHHNRMQTVDRWLVGHMLGWLGCNPKALDSLGGIGISLSGRSLGDPGLLEFIFDRMSEKGAPIERLWFEIAEAAAFDNLEYVVEFMNEMKELGCQFCLGSFGGRTESYELLKRLPVDRIKLDGTFLNDLLRCETDQARVRSMTDMAHFLGREVIACQVEERDAVELLRALGVDYAQGSGIEKPRPLES